jgi:hypothetical protein
MAPIQDLVRRGRRRLRLQAALDGATAAAIGASVWAGTMVVLIRMRVLAPEVGVGLLLAAPVVVAAAAIAAALRRHGDDAIARRIDRTSGLADRLATAVAFDAELARAPDDDGFREAAILDAVRAVPRARVEDATPFRRPRATIGALAAAVVALAIAILVPLVRDPTRGPVPRPVVLQPHADPRGPWDTGYAHDAVDRLRRRAIEHHADAIVALANILERSLGSLEAGAIDKVGLLDSLSLAERAAVNELPLVDEEVAIAMGDVSEAIRRVEPRDPVSAAQVDPPEPGTIPPPPPQAAPPTPPPPPGPQPSTGPGVAPGDDLLGLPDYRMHASKDVALAGDPPHATGTRKQTISDAARRGFASAPYREIFEEYEPANEEVLHAENVPAGQRYIVKRYFYAIRPGN